MRESKRLTTRRKVTHSISHRITRRPILYAFDPGARGRLPVEHFKAAAEKYGWIVVGSNNSRNGPWNVVVNAWNAMNYFEAIKPLKLATEVNPDRPGAFFYLAWAYAANRDKKKSLQSLNTAVEKSFSDAAMITTNKAFDSLRNDPEYQQIMAKLRK